MDKSTSKDHECFAVQEYTRVWRVGSGVSDVLTPGVHHITARTSNYGRVQVIIDEVYYLSEEDFAKVLPKTSE